MEIFYEIRLIIDLVSSKQTHSKQFASLIHELLIVQLVMLMILSINDEQNSNLL